jgi:hypothetical protein
MDPCRTEIEDGVVGDHADVLALGLEQGSSSRRTLEESLQALAAVLQVLSAH